MSLTNDISISDFSVLQENDGDYISKLYDLANDENAKNDSFMLGSPKMDMDRTGEIVFKFENPTSSHIYGNEDVDTGVTQKIKTEANCETKAISVTGTTQCKPSGDKNEERPEAHQIDTGLGANFTQPVDQSESKNLKSSSEFQKPKVRRDVINKTTFRIIRRYFHSVLEKLIPGYKKHKKQNLMSMLVSFSEYVFPEITNSLEMAQVLRALMFRREVLLEKHDQNNRKNIQVFLDIQSKYTHRLISEAMSNRYFREVFKYFLDNGISFYEQDENVLAHNAQYSAELEKIKAIYFSTS